MPGSHVNDQQVRIYMRLRIHHMQVTAAAKAGISVATARRIEHDPRQTRKCIDAARPLGRNHPVLGKMGSHGIGEHCTRSTARSPCRGEWLRSSAQHVNSSVH